MGGRCYRIQKAQEEISRLESEIEELINLSHSTDVEREKKIEEIDKIYNEQIAKIDELISEKKVSISNIEYDLEEGV